MHNYYSPSNTNFNYNGDYSFQPLSSKVINKDFNTIPTIEIELPFDDNGKWKNVVENGVWKSPVPWNNNGDLFRIYETEKDMDTETYKVYGRQIFGDLMTTTAKDLSNDDIMICQTGIATGQQALNKLLNGTQFTGYSDIITTNNARWERKEITEALLSNDENSFVNKWGGELFVDNFNVYMNNKIGTDNNVRISYGKNLTGITVNINTESVVTRIIPIGYNGLRLTGSTPYVNSPNINKYPKVYEKVIEYSDVKVKENSDDTEGFANETLARAELIRLANLEYSKNNIDLPIINIKTTMVDISNTLEYKTMGYSSLENINKGDTLTLYYEDFDINMPIRCIGYEWDALKEEMLEVELGDVTKSFFDKQTDLSNTLTNLLDGDKVKADSLAGLINGLQTRFKAQKDISQKQHIRAMLFEDSDPTSSTYGATAIGTVGLQIANKKVNNEWQWNTFITGGLVYADQLIGNLKTVLIENADGSFKIDLKETGGATFYNNGMKAMEMSRNALKLYNWAKDGDYIGSVGALINRGDPNLPYISIYHDIDSSTSLGYERKDTNSVPSYMEFDKYNIHGSHPHPITVYESAEFRAPIYLASSIRGEDKNIAFEGDYMWFSPVGGGASGMTLDKNGNVNFGGEIHCSALSVSSSNKNRIMNTSQGKVRVNAVESAEYIFTDKGRGFIGQDGTCVIKLEKKFTEIIETYDYDLFIQPLGAGKAYYLEEECFEDGFIVHGDPYTNFKYKIEAIQINMNGKRLEKFDESKFNSMKEKIDETKKGVEV